MDTVIQLIVDKTGISEDQARKAAQIVTGYLKDRLPGPVAGQLDSALGGDGQSREQGGAENLAGKVGL